MLRAPPPDGKVDDRNINETDDSSHRSQIGALGFVGEKRHLGQLAWLALDGTAQLCRVGRPGWAGEGGQAEGDRRCPRLAVGEAMGAGRNANPVCTDPR